jgi:hypothetical protein
MARTSVSVANGVVYAASDRLRHDATSGTILCGGIGPRNQRLSTTSRTDGLRRGSNGRLYAFGLPN